MIGLGAVNREMGRYEESAKWYGEALDINPSLEMAHDGLAKTIARMNEAAASRPAR
jgi:hypothetical protein